MPIDTSSQTSAPAGYAKGRARREQILEVARRMFAEVGYLNASMVKIASDCGVSRAGLLHHFPSKELLLRAVLEERDREDLAVFFDADDPGNGLGYFRRLLRLVAHNERNPGIIHLYAALSAEAVSFDHPAHDFFDMRYRAIRSGMIGALTQMQDAGVLRDRIDPVARAAELIGMLDGLQIQWLYDRSIGPMTAIVRARFQELTTIPFDEDDESAPTLKA